MKVGRERESNRGKLAKLETSISEVNALVRDQRLGGGHGMVGTLPAVEGRIARLELTLMQVKVSIGGEVVKIGQETFHSPLEVENWVIKHVGELGILEGWIDVVSMLELLSDSGKSSDAQMEGQAKAKKAGFDSQEESRLVNSFLTVVPSAFNPLSNKKELFPAIAKFEDFDCDDGSSEFVNSLDEAINI
jgi:hypothetical protein